MSLFQCGSNGRRAVREVRIMVAGGMGGGERVGLPWLQDVSFRYT
jgi:hypothetical protein